MTTILDGISLPNVILGGVLGFLTWRIVALYIFFRPRDEHSIRSVAILVLGDIGRSPRMMYHAQSFAENGFQTDVIGYGGMLHASFTHKPLTAMRQAQNLSPRWNASL